ncbi:MAG: DnaJ domain-containing protein [Clostridia bacterium]|nr:DnaJ domain-containing protein [Clostridia bacterium]
MIFKDYYKILEIESSKVTLEEIKIAYRKVAKKYHPDVNVKDKLAEERIKDINEAYRVLSNPQAKRKYDRMWNSNARKNKKAFSESTSQGGSVFSNFFYIFFGNLQNSENIDLQKNRPIKGENIETSINIGVEEAYYGVNKKISLKTLNGKTKTYDISVSEGIKNGEKIRLIGQGKEGKNGGKNGDIFIKININDEEKFKIVGNDLHTHLLITPWEAALGTKANINTIDKEETTIYVPQGIQTGDKLKIPGKGYKNKQGGRGDLIAEVKVVVPKNLTHEEEKLLKKLKEVSKFNPRNAKKVDKV